MDNSEGKLMLALVYDEFSGCFFRYYKNDDLVYAKSSSVMDYKKEDTFILDEYKVEGTYAICTYSDIRFKVILKHNSAVVGTHILTDTNERVYCLYYEGDYEYDTLMNNVEYIKTM